MNEVTLRPYLNRDEKTVMAFGLPPDQLPYTALPADSLPLCEEDEGRLAMVICSDDVPVGFFVLHTGPGITPFTDNPCAVLLRALLIDGHRQGNGFAHRAMTLLPEWVSRRFPQADEIILAVNQGNLHAQRLYLKCGFQDRGLRRMGPKGEQLLLRYRLSEEPDRKAE